VPYGYNCLLRESYFAEFGDSAIVGDVSECLDELEWYAGLCELYFFVLDNCSDYSGLLYRTLFDVRPREKWRLSFCLSSRGRFICSLR
jgi:hypothetical protein